MLFNTLSTLGLATLAVAAPQFDSRNERDLAQRDPVLAVERGLVWTPRSVEARKNGQNKKNNNNNDKITITQLQETQLTEVQKGKEVELTTLVEKKLVVINQTKKNKDNIRKNHFKNKNNNVNTVLIVVTQVIDQRDSKNVNTRYMTHQVQSNEGAPNQEMQMLVVSDAQAMTIGGNTASAVQQAAAPAGTGSVAQNVATFDPNAAPVPNNNTQILPAGQPAPSFAGTQVGQDPAAIIQENQAMFVQFAQS